MKGKAHNRKTITRVILSAVLFFMVALPFRQLLSLMPGITEIRPANVIPPVLGLIWGPAAALGIAVGNLISDILSGSNVFICAGGFLANFFYAYLPYKLWYSTRVDEENPYPTLGSVGKILKYIYVILLDSLVVTGLLSLIFETAGFSGSGSSYALLFLNNFDFAVLLGVPVLILLERFHPDYCVPCRGSKRAGSYYGFDGMLVIAAASGLVWFGISWSAGAPVRSRGAGILLCICILFVLPILAKPFHFDPERAGVKKENKEIKTTIKTKVVIGFLMLSVIFIAFIGMTAYHSYTGSDTLEHWSMIYQTVGLAINIIFAVAIVFLGYVEKYIVNPLELLAKNVKEFATSPADAGEIPIPRITTISTGDEISLLADSCNTMMRDITAYMYDLRTVTAEKERIGAELSVATEIQASMLPCIFPAFPERREFDIYATMSPAKEVGGDFYDFFLVDEDHLALVIADVSGKGVPAALFMVIAKTLIKNCAQTGLSPKEVLEKVNVQLCENNEAQMFVTVWLGILEIPTGKVVCANAGHEYPAVRHGEGDYELVKDRHGFVLAGMETARYREYELVLHPGDSLYVYTDGVAEATNAKEELFGTDRMLLALNSHKEALPGELLPLVKEDIDAFVGEAPQFDDITMLCLKLREG